jgi:hypothetical protein
VRSTLEDVRSMEGLGAWWNGSTILKPKKHPLHCLTERAADQVQPAIRISERVEATGRIDKDNHVIMMCARHRHKAAELYEPSLDEAGIFLPELRVKAHIAGGQVSTCPDGAHLHAAELSDNRGGMAFCRHSAQRYPWRGKRLPASAGKQWLNR